MLIVWCVGSSLIKRGSRFARSQDTGSNIGLHSITLWWQGYGGLSLFSIREKFRTLFLVGDTPTAILIHCGGNDLGLTPLKSLRNLVKLIFVLLKEQYSSANVIWSEILPRSVWRYSDNLQAMERCRKRLNGFAGKLAIEKGGAYISHPLLRKGDSKYFLHHGVHLSEAGNYILCISWVRAYIAT